MSQTLQLLSLDPGFWQTEEENFTSSVLLVIRQGSCRWKNKMSQTLQLLSLDPGFCQMKEQSVTNSAIIVTRSWVLADEGTKCNKFCPFSH
jgi:hypothetical protein